VSSGDVAPGPSLTLDGALVLESGERLPSVTVAGGRLVTLASPHGHDAFLIEGEAANALVTHFRRGVENGSGREERTWVA
jgi:homoserine acetyltransferase